MGVFVLTVRLQELGLFHLENRLRAVSSMHVSVMGECKKTNSSYSVVSSDAERSNGHKLKCKKIHLNRRKLFSTVKVTIHRNILVRGTMESPYPRYLSWNHSAALEEPKPAK